MSEGHPVELPSDDPRERIAVDKTGPIGPQEHEDEHAAFQETDVANAHRVGKHFANDLLWVKGLGWLVWILTHWMVSETRALALVQKLGRIIRREASVLMRVAANCGDESKREKLDKQAKDRFAWARFSEGKERIRAALDLARPHLEIEIEKFDANPWLLPVANGVIDLRTGTCREHRREDYCTKLAPVVFDPQARCPLWERFISEVSCGNAELIAYKQRFYGYSLTGLTLEQVVHFLVGGGSNGKSTEVQTIEGMLGPFAVRALPELLMTSGFDRHPTELMALRGARLVLCAEVPEGREWHSPRIKELTGERKITARSMRQDPVSFEVTAKLVVTSNHHPEVSDQSHAFWRRMRVIPFERVFAEHEQDRELLDKLHAERSGILNWCLAGLATWRKDGLGQPPAVQQAVAEYRAKADTVGSFLATCCRTGADLRVGPGELFDAYRAWAQEHSVEAATPSAFKTRIVELGFGRSTIHGKQWWTGLALTEQPADPRGADEGHARNQGRGATEGPSLAERVMAAGGWDAYLSKQSKG